MINSPHVLWPIWSVADMDFPCGRYGLAVANIIVDDMVCGRYGRTAKTLKGQNVHKSIQCISSGLFLQRRLFAATYLFSDRFFVYYSLLYFYVAVLSPGRPHYVLQPMHLSVKNGKPHNVQT